CGNSRQSGQATIVLGLLISFFILLICGLFGFNLNRVEVARQQLRSACEAASLAGAATLASQDSVNAGTAQTQAMNVALNTFQNNSVIGVGLSNAVFGYSTNDNPAVDHSSLFIEFLDPHNNNQPVSLGDPNGKIIRVTAALGYLPPFANVLNLGPTVLRSVASAGVP